MGKELEDLNSSAWLKPECLCTSVQLLWTAKTGLLGFAGFWASSGRFRERPCLKGLRQSVC